MNKRNERNERNETNVGCIDFQMWNATAAKLNDVTGWHIDCALRESAWNISINNGTDESGHRTDDKWSYHNIYIWFEIGLKKQI